MNKQELITIILKKQKKIDELEKQLQISNFSANDRKTVF